jgi:hypothetical protein
LPLQFACIISSTYSQVPGMNFLRNSLFAIGFLLATSLEAADVKPVKWPNEFSVRFVSNVTWNITSREQVTPIPATMYYNWDIQSQLVEHGAGAVECLHFYNSALPCKLYFTKTGLYRVLERPLPPGEPECCLDMPQIKASPPNWAIVSNATYEGVQKDVYSQIEAESFSFLSAAGPMGPHKYFQTVATKLPLIFTFPAHSGRQDYHFDPTSMSISPQDPKLFALPSGCFNVLCNSTTGQHY